jgi:hypothetical protein
LRGFLTENPRSVKFLTETRTLFRREASHTGAVNRQLVVADCVSFASPQAAKLNKRKVKFEELLERVQAEKEVSTVDPDARLMRLGGDARPLDVCHNVQTVVDSKHHLIVDFEIINRSDDKGNLRSLSESAMEALDTDAVTVLADKGYYDGEDIVACEENGVMCLVAKPLAGGTEHSDGFARGDFHYNRENDCYTCPCQNRLRFMRTQNNSDGKEYRVYTNYPACVQCLRRSECTHSKYRKILRLPYQDAMDVVDERTRNNKELYRKRSEIVEHPFGTIKAIWGYKQLLCRGKQVVNAETALAYLAYNLRRAVSIFKENGESLTTAIG